MGHMDKVYNSWERSRSFGVDPVHVVNDLLTGGELNDRKERLEELFSACASVLDDLYKRLRQSLYMVLVSDPDGYIVFSQGEPPFTHRAKKIWLNTGANWSEQVKGTNAIGTALFEQQPVSVVGDEHFCRENHFLTCYAAPLFGKKGELLGVLDVSGDARLHHAHTYGLVMTAAEACQSRLLLQQTQKEMTLNLRETGMIANQIDGALISVDRDGLITQLNQRAARMLGETPGSCIGQPLFNWFNRHDTERVLSMKTQGSVHIKLKDNSNNWIIEPVKDERQTIYRSVLKLPDLETNEPSSPTNKQHETVWECPKARNILDLARNISKTNASVLVRGETGTGKEIIAQELHKASGRKGQLITVNCGAIPEALIESELFGYEKGAFTGASQKGHIGKFEAADKGTLFLDEIGEMPYASQVSLIRVLEEKTVTPVGTHRAKPVDVRIVAATNRDLIHEINEKRFRADLYYRLCEIELTLPPLRNRTDSFILANRFLRQMAIELNVAELRLDEFVKEEIKTYHWPGNIRELRHIIRQAAYTAYFSRQSTTITIEDIHFPRKEIEPDRVSTDLETELIQAIQKASGNMSRTAKHLGIGRTTLYRKLKHYPHLQELREKEKQKANKGSNY